VSTRLGHLFRVANPHAPSGPEVWRSQAYEATGDLFVTIDPATRCLVEVNLHVR
jgi:hypothetical protein